jgi:hypothetical protein
MVSNKRALRLIVYCFRLPMARRLSLNEDEIEPPRFIIDSEINRRYTRFNAVGTQLTV